MPRRDQFDMTDAAAVDALIRHYRAWAIVNVAGYIRVDEAEKDQARCLRENVQGPTNPAVARVKQDIERLTFSSDLVFDGASRTPYVESDLVARQKMYGASKAEAERLLLGTHPTSLVICTSSFFGPWDSHNFVTQVLRALSWDVSFITASDITVSPTYVPDLVHACLDLLVDRECGMWHMTNGGAVRWTEFAQRVAELEGIDARAHIAKPAAQLGHTALRAHFSALCCERAHFLPGLDDALRRSLMVVKTLGVKQKRAAQHVGG